jgi:hypothetical protein
MKALAAACLLALAACGHLPGQLSEAPSDWPQLRVIEHQGSWLEIVGVCSKYTNILTWPPLACAEFDFEANTCTTWFIGAWTRAEELKHCEGEDHGGTLHAAWERFKVERMRRFLEAQRQR